MTFNLNCDENDYGMHDASINPPGRGGKEVCKTSTDHTICVPKGLRPFCR